MPKRTWNTKKSGFFSFLMAFLLCFGVFMGTAFALLRAPANTLPSPPTESKIAPVWGSLNTVVLLAVGQTPADAAYYTLDIKAELQSGFLEPVPSRSVTVNGRADTLAGHAARGGIPLAKSAAEQLCNAKVSRYVFLTPDALAAFCDTLGGVILSSGGVQQRYAGAQFAELLQQDDPHAPLCRLLQQFFADEGSLAAGASLLFAAADTDLSAPDLQDNKSALLGLTVY